MRRRCEDKKMWRWEDVKMRRCEDEKMWRWEDVLQTPTIGRTLRSDALGKKLQSSRIFMNIPELSLHLGNSGQEKFREANLLVDFNRGAEKSGYSTRCMKYWPARKQPMRLWRFRGQKRCGIPRIESAQSLHKVCTKSAQSLQTSQTSNHSKLQLPTWHNPSVAGPSVGNLLVPTLENQSWSTSLSKRQNVLTDLGPRCHLDICHLRQVKCYHGILNRPSARNRWKVKALALVELESCWSKSTNNIMFPRSLCTEFPWREQGKGLLERKLE
jgi:hypothetical protein